ncbi:MAG: glycosyltransferase [Methanosarcinaceae archaeon]|nr:glycosyltransferase [Methanosarcinaceae archaeon]
MKIVNIIQRYPPAIGGSETWCQEVCQYLAGKGHQVKVLTLDVNYEEHFGRPPLDSERTIALGRIAFDKGVFVRRYPISLPIHIFHHLIYGILLDRLLKIYFYGPHSGEMYGKMWREIRGADIVFLHTLPYSHNFVAFFLAKCFRKKIIIAPHFHPTHPHYERASNYWLLKHCDAVITVSPFEKEYLKEKGIAEKRLFVTGNAIHPEDYLPSDLNSFRNRVKRDFGLRPEDRVITFVGRKTPEKGVSHLIEAIKNLLHEKPLKLFLIGPNLDWCQEIYASLSQEEKKRIIDVGVVSQQDKVNFLHISDLLVLPSKFEAFGIVFLESWICGVPVLGTTEGAMPSVIGKEGLLCKFGDVEDLTSKIREALKNTKSLAEMGSRGKAKVLNHYTWNKIGAKAERAVRIAYGKKKILICSNTNFLPCVDDADLTAYSHAQILKKRGYKVLIFTGRVTDKGKRYRVEKDIHEGIQVQRVYLHSQGYSEEAMNVFHKELNDLFERLLSAFSPDIVHFHSINGLSGGLPEVARLRKIRTVLTLYDYWAVRYKNTLINGDDVICEDLGECEKCQPSISGNRWAHLLSRMRNDYIALQLRGIDAVISPSVDLAKTYERSGLFRHKITVVPNGIDIARFQKVHRKKNHKEVRFSFIGHLGRHKGAQTIIDALHHIDAKDRVKVNLVGEGEQRSELEEIVRHLGMKESVKFWGKVENRHIEKVYSKTDVLILPSIWPENQPVTIAEAMACSLPVIGARIGGIPELVEDGKTGYLFEAGNPEDLALKMSMFLGNPSKIPEFGDNGFKKISHCTLENQVDDIIETYCENESPIAGRLHDENLIICLGREILPECVEGLNNLASASERDYKLVMCDWLDEDIIKEAKFLCVLDKRIDWKAVMVGLRNKIPLLVPEAHEKLKELCVAGNCGLFYGADPIALQASLQYLIKNEPVRASMGRNAFKVFYSRANE